MLQIYLENVQTIDQFLFKFPDRGIVQFRGNNSNGKSILFKAVSRIVLQMLQYDDKRLPLIQDGKHNATVSFVYNNKALVVAINEDVNKTVYTLVRQDGEKVHRRVREGGISEMLREFGFVVYGKNLVCLQICETFGLMPFVNTPDTLNGEIVNSVTTDIPSEQFIDNYKLTFKEAKSRVQLYKREIATCQATIDNRKIKDVTGYAELIARSKEVQKRNTYLKRVEQITLEPFPKLEFVIKPIPKLGRIPIVQRMNTVNKLYNLDQQIVDMKKIKNGKCPMCGRPFLEGGHNNACKTDVSR